MPTTTAAIHDLLHARSAQAARSGDYPTAERILRRLEEEEAGQPGDCLLLGKILAQQGRLEEAIREWKKVPPDDPSAGAAAAAIARAERLRAPSARPWLSQTGPWTGVVLACLAVVVMIVAAVGLHQAGRAAGITQADAVFSSDLRGSHVELAQLRQEIAGLPQEQQTNTRASERRLRQLLTATEQRMTRRIDSLQRETRGNNEELRSLLAKSRVGEPRAGR